MHARRELTFGAKESTVGKLETLVSIPITLITDVTGSNGMAGVELYISLPVLGPLFPTYVHAVELQVSTFTDQHRS
jgi:hypothetical protein